MTRERARELLPVIQGWVEGKELQIQITDEVWIECKDPSWNFDTKYRIKPSLKEFWVEVTPLGSPVSVRLLKDLDSGYQCIKVREVVE